MQGHHSSPSPRLMVVDLDRLVPDDHRLRKIDRVIDLSFIGPLTEFLYTKGKGRPSIDPQMFFRMMIIAFLDGIHSDRELCRQISVNLAYRWYLRLGLDESVPDHSSLTRIRDRLGEETFQAIFQKIVKACQRAGFVSGQRLITDSTLVEADASLDSLAPNDQRGSMISEEEIPGRLKTKSYRERVVPAKKAHKKIRYSNDTHRSTSDPDARLVAGRNKGRKLLHKATFTIDAASRIVTDCHIAGGNVQDVELLRPRIAAQVKTFHFAPDELLADKGFGSGETYEYLHTRGVTTYIPCFDRHPETTAHRRQFYYDQEDDIYVCPMGEELSFRGEDACGAARYQAEVESCASCPLKRSCIISRDAAKSLTRRRYQATIDSVTQRMETRPFKRKMHERLWKVEGIIGEAKRLCGLERARYRGRAKVQIQAYLTATVQNLKRVASSPMMPASIYSSHRFRCRGAKP